jgi:uncharacterized protein (DUF433 family)
MSEIHRITVDPGQYGGRPCLRNLRIRVKDLLDLLAAGATREEIPGRWRHHRRARIRRAAKRSSGATFGVMRFIVDAQLPPALARFLTANGHEAEHVGDRGLQSASDRTIWDFALQENAAIVAKDEDFAQGKALAAARPPPVNDPSPASRKYISSRK